MADNVVISAGTGTTVHADEYTHATLGSGKTQLVKLVDGTLDSGTAIAAGGGVEAGALRVTIASDSTGVLSIDDNGGAITVDGTVTANLSAVDNAVLDAIAASDASIDGKITACNTGAVVLAAGVAAIGKLAANTGVDIGDVDVTSVVPGTGATNLGKAEDAAHTTGDVGVMSLAVRFDAGGALAGTDLDYSPLQVDANGALRVTGGGGGTEYTEDVATANPIVGSAVMMERDDIIAALTPIEGDWASLRCSAEGALWVQDFNSDASLALLGTIDGKITACNTGAVVISSGTITAVTAISNALPAGTNAIGKLAANSGVDIGDVDVLSIAAGDNNIGNVDIVTVPAPLNVVGTGTEATALRVTLASDSTGVLSVDDNGGALTVDWAGTAPPIGAGVEATALRVTIANDSTGVVTVDGTVTAELSATDNAVLDTIDAVLDTINAKLVTGTVIGDVNLGATDNAVLDSIVTNTNRAAITGYGQAKLDHADVTTAQVLVAAVADKKFYITSIILSVAAAGSYWIEDDDAAQITCKYTLAANGGLAVSFPIDTPFKSTTVNKGLKVKGSAAGVIGCMITYYVLA